MNRRQFVGTSVAAIAASALSTTNAGEPTGETLYNGIKLPSVWPPKWKELPAKPATPPYLESPPAIISIDLGRQLFVDDFLIEHSTLKRTFHQPREHKDNPLLRPDQPWELVGASPMAMPFSDGVWYDPKDRLFKMWYMGGYGQAVCLAFSEDGVRWTKPKFDVKKGSDITHPGPRDSATVWLSSHETDPKRRFVLFRSHSDGKRFGQSLHFSPDGIHWSEPVLRTGSTGDRTTAFYNPFRKVWVYSIRHGWGLPRRRRYWETADLVKGPMWNAIDEPGMWTGSDSLDHQRDDLKTVPQLYNLDCVAYESVLLGMFSIWRGDKNIPPGRPKPNDICLGFSRDGFYWHRPDRRAFIGVSEKPGDWNWGNLQSVGGCCLVVGDELWFYHSGRAGSPGGKGNRDAGGAAGLAILRRDGFASLGAGDEGGTVTTRPLQFNGQHLFVNADAKNGEVAAELLGQNGRVIAGFARSDCIACRADRTKQRLVWKKGDLKAVVGTPVKLRFYLKNARIYAFWVSSGESGASNGFVAAGGPGLTDRDA